MKKRKRLKKKYSLFLSTLLLAGCATVLLWDLANSKEGKSSASAQTMTTDVAYEVDGVQEECRKQMKILWLKQMRFSRAAPS